MELQKLCINCMQAQMTGGICPRCGWKEKTGRMQDTAALPARRMLCGRYYVGKVLGIGGFGITYLAYDCKEKRRVAVKELFPCKDVTRRADSQEIQIHPGQESFFLHVKQRFIEEAQNLNRFRGCPGIVNVYHYFEENHTAYYVMEYLEGQDLKHALKQRGTMGWGQLSAYVRMLLRALYVLHGQNLIHRDISPDNIFLTKDNRAFLIDFGSVRCYKNPGGLTTFLKACFAPPEQYREKGNHGPWSDIYSLSVTLYYALSGVMPQKAPDRLLDERTIYLGTLCPGLPDHVAAAITKGMAVRAEERFQNVADFGERLFPGQRLFGGQPEGAFGVRTGQRRRGWRLVFVRGRYQGKSMELWPGQLVTVGRYSGCTISYPADSRNISRAQCSLLLDGQGRLCVRDEKSSNGTFLNGKRLPPKVWQPLAEGNHISFAQEVYQVRQEGI